MNTASEWRIPFGYGEPIPVFQCATPQNPRFNFTTLGGLYLVMSFVGDPNGEPARSLIDFFLANQAIFDGDNLALFTVISARPERDAPIPTATGIRFFLDYEKKVHELYKAERPYTLVLDPRMRVLATIEADDVPRHNVQLLAALENLPRLTDRPAGEGLHAPVLILPRVFEPEFCRELIGLYQLHGGEESGYMREVDGKTVPIINPNFKRRKDFNFHEGDAFIPLRREINRRINRRLVPQIQKAFQFTVTRMERYVVACYTAEAQGFFRAHRDNTTPGTAHRRFACTINLNAEEYEGGNLRFPEFGRQTYRAPTGGACIFSCSLLHEATPVTRGNRYAFLPFFYNEQAAEIRRQNAETIETETRFE